LATAAIPPRTFAQTANAPAKSAFSPNPSGLSRAIFAPRRDGTQMPASFIGNQVFLPAREERSEPSLIRRAITSKPTCIGTTRMKELSLPNVTTTVLNLPGSDLIMKVLPAVDNKDFAAEVGRTYEGTLGNDFLNCYVAEIDYSRQTLQLYDPGPYVYSGKS